MSRSSSFWKLEPIIRKLWETDLIKQGEFTLKSGQPSDIYFDCRELISSFEFLEEISVLISERLIDKNHKYTLPRGNQLLVCGVPMGAIPLATLISQKSAIPQVLLRKEPKNHGMGKMVEGCYEKGDACILIEDVVTTGSSVQTAINQLEYQGLKVCRVVCLIDRGDNVKFYNLQKQQITKKWLFNIDQIKQVGIKYGHYRNLPTEPYTHPLTIKLREIMQKKKTNICLSFDQNEYWGEDHLREYLEKMAPYICILKIHSELFFPSDKALHIQKFLHSECQRLNILLMEDRKFADIAFIVGKQIDSCYSHVDLVTAHAISGPDMIQEINSKGKGVVLVHTMSTDSNLCSAKYSHQCIEMGRKNQIMGFVTQWKIGMPNMIKMMPGVKRSRGSGEKGQNYQSISDAMRKEADIVIIGRGITNAEDPFKEAELCRELAWRYMENED